MYRKREPYNNSRRVINNKIRTQTTLSQTMTHLIMVNRFHHFSDRMPETSNTNQGNGNFTIHTYQVTETGGHTHHTTPFSMLQKP